MRLHSGLLALALLVAGCGASANATVVVSAASSLTDAFRAIEAAFEAANPGIDVVINFGGSATLREQIAQGAPVDVFAPADVADMQALAEEGLVVPDAAVFATNSLVIATAAGNPAGFTGIGDFARQEPLIGLCAAGVPCGDLARQALTAAGVEPSIDTEEPNVRALLTKIEAGELDAGIVYVTDLAAAPDAEGIAFGSDVVAMYPIARVVSAPNPGGADRFIAFILSDTGRSILAEYGFGSP